jgi:hypothetical protein
MGNGVSQIDPNAFVKPTSAANNTSTTSQVDETQNKELKRLGDQAVEYQNQFNKHVLSINSLRNYFYILTGVVILLLIVIILVYKKRKNGFGKRH